METAHAFGPMLTRPEVSVRPEDTVILPPPHPYFIRHPELSKVPNQVYLNDLIEKADEFVSISPEGHASVAKGIKKALSPPEVEWVEQLIELHNVKLLHPPPKPYGTSTPPADTTSTPTDTSSTSQALDPPPQPCTPHVSISFYWWGFRIHMDHCFCKLVTGFGGPVAGAVTVIGAIFAAAGLGGPWVALAAGIILLMVAWIAWADGYCTPNSGANYNQTWTVQGWITTVC